MFGTVIRYSRETGFGFIAPLDDPQGQLPDYFVCHRFIVAESCRRFLVPGQKVEFDPADDAGRPQAHNVRVIGVTVARQTSTSVRPTSTSVRP